MKYLNAGSGSADVRLLIAVGCSVAVHLAVIGGWALWDHRSSTAPEGVRAVHGEIRVRVQSPDPDPPAVPMPSVRKFPALDERQRRALSRQRIPEAVSASRALADPASGLIFSAYFKAVKSRLASEAGRRSFSADRDIPVHFVLTRDGGVAAVSTPPGTPDALRRVVEDLLAAASPFPPFPGSLQHESIAFDVLFRCDRNVLV